MPPPITTRSAERGRVSVKRIGGRGAAMRDPPGPPDVNAPLTEFRCRSDIVLEVRPERGATGRAGGQGRMKEIGGSGCRDAREARATTGVVRGGHGVWGVRRSGQLLWVAGEPAGGAVPG